MGKKKKHMKHAMANEPMSGSDVHANNMIPITLEELFEEERHEIEQELEAEKMEKLKKKLESYQRTRNGFIKRDVVSTSMQETEVSKLTTTEEIAHFIDASVASKYGRSMNHMARTLTQSVSEQLDCFKRNFNQDFQNNLYLAMFVQ